MSALMAADGRLFFEDDDAGAGETLTEAPGGCESDDSSADDYDTFSHLVIIGDMLIVMKAQATESDIDRVRERIESLGFRPHVMPGAGRTAIGITGNPGPVDPVEFEAMS
jgi:hypothetical protein